MRLDLYIKEKYNFSREYSQTMIKEGNVSVNGKFDVKPSLDVCGGDKIEIMSEKLLKYVSRGGLKLEKALEYFNIDPSGLICMDIGSSTGGFTDCLIQNNAQKVYAVDCGTQQLAQKLRENPKVIVMENTNIRYVHGVEDETDLITADVSFISLDKIMPNIYDILKPDGQAVLLIKPQFETQKSNIGKGGIVKNPKIHKKIIGEMFLKLDSFGFKIKGITYSPIKGTKGNVEYLIFISKSGEQISYNNFMLSAESCIKQAFTGGAK